MESKHNVTQKVVDYFIQNIENGQWPVNEKIPSEKQITDALGVSRSSVRGAMQRFVGLGVMESFQGKGTFLRTDDVSGVGEKSAFSSLSNIENARALLEFRLMLEPEAVRVATQKADEETIDKLNTCYKLMRDSVGSPEAFVKYDLKFHQEIAKGSKNPFVEAAIEEVFTKESNILRGFNEAFGYIDGIYYHGLVLKAMETKNAKAAKRAMQEHLQKALDDMVSSDG